MATEPATSETTDVDQPAYRIIAGECVVETRGTINETHRGQILTIAKPDGTVLVHDTAGYKPIAWITRADSVTTDSTNGTLTAVDGDQWVSVTVEHGFIDRRLPASPAGSPVSDCPSCGGTLVDASGEIYCLGCRVAYGLPSGATLREESCACGLPTMRIERGDVFDLCIDRECEPMEEAIAERFDRKWSCPDSTCTGTLRVLRRSRLIVGCSAYPDCEVAYTLPNGVIDGHCSCGLPRFANESGLRCLDSSCDRIG